MLRPERAGRMEDAVRVDRAASAWYFFSAVRARHPKFVSASAPMNDDDRRLNVIVAVELPLALQLW
jgi:hypothetical protein